MADPPPYPNAGDDAGADPDATNGTSRWMYLLVAIGVLVVVLFVALHLAGVLGPGAH